MFQNKNAVGRKFVATPGMGMGGGGILLFLIMIKYIFHTRYICFYHVSTFIRPYMGKGDVYEPMFNFLEMTHTNLFSSIQNTAYLSLI